MGAAARIAIDEWGVRRRVKAGDELPQGWRWEKPPEKPKPKAAAKPKQAIKP